MARTTAVKQLNLTGKDQTTTVPIKEKEKTYKIKINNQPFSVEPQFSKNAQEILAKRYLIKDKNNKPIETPKDLLIRVAKAIAKADLKYSKNKKHYLNTAEKFYNIMANLEFFPNSPTLRGAGREIHQLSACFVLPVEDTMEGIFDSLKATSLVHKGGGGTGFNFGHLRPHGDKVGSTDGVAGGPLSFMKIFDTTSHEVMQGGVRVGANMGILPVDHPDILEFIHCKEDGQSYTNFNLSVAMTKKFMEHMEKNEEFDLINPRNGKISKRLKAREVFNEITNLAWKNGDPGIIFIDRINQYNPTPELGKIESTNPCGEQPLLPYESCNLGSINLARMVKNNKINWDRLAEVTKTAIHFLDNVIDENRFVMPEIEKMTRGNRKIGLGIMGFADMLAILKIAYNSEEGIKTAEKVMSFIQKQSKEQSAILAKIRGAFPNYPKSIYAKQKGAKKLRNATTTTIAPTGTLSLLGNCSGGIEPFFSIVYKKKSIFRQDGTAEIEQTYVSPTFEQYLKDNNLEDKKLIDRISDSSSLKNIEELPLEAKKIFVTAHDITPDWHVKMQAAFQKYTDNAVSKTINFPKEATIKDVEKAYLLAYQTGCKGITIYRDGSRENQVLTTLKTEKVEPKPAEKIKIIPRERPEIVQGTTYKIKTAYGNLFVTINNDDQGEPFEVFTTIGKAGGFFAAKAEAISRLVSLALRCGIDPQEIIKQLKGIRGPTPIWGESGMILSLPDAIGQVLERNINKVKNQQLDLTYQNDNSSIDPVVRHKEPIADLGIAPACPECGSVLEMGEGCLKCPGCGYSKCA